MPSESPKVWLITGTSSGFGRCLVHSVLERGDLVIATARSLEKVQDFPSSDRLRVLHLDVDHSRDVIQARIDEAVKFWGRIDVLVNNAGSVIRGLFEEGGSDTMLKQYRTNVFGLINVTTATLPYMRAARSGTVVMMGSRTSWQSNIPQTAFYSSSKAAVRSFSEALAVEVRQFNIRVMIVEPGGFKTKNITALEGKDGGECRIADYDNMRDIKSGKFREAMEVFKGDPKKGMEVVVDVVRGEGKAKGRPWPLHLFIGKEAYYTVRSKCKEVAENMDTWEEVTKDLDFDEGVKLI
ncbi:hypothetical protein AX15_005121 [Amanita polypyramis BW_CC]|nr:hypothetical protein AX15_005121 [Amanita polypyramis BW_CC]